MSPAAIGAGTEEGGTRPSVVYQGFLDALNHQDLDAATRWVNVERYRENCVAFTKGFVDWEEAKASVTTIWKALPDLRVELHEVADGPEYAIARGTVRGTAEGRLYGAPATKRSFEASFFDYVEVEDDLIVKRVQQSDVIRADATALWPRARPGGGRSAVPAAITAVHRAIAGPASSFRTTT